MVIDQTRAPTELQIKLNPNKYGVNKIESVMRGGPHLPPSISVCTQTEKIFQEGLDTRVSNHLDVSREGAWIPSDQFEEILKEIRNDDGFAAAYLRNLINSEADPLDLSFREKTLADTTILKVTENVKYKIGENIK